MMRRKKRGCKGYWEANEFAQPFKPRNYYAKLGIKPYAPGQPKTDLLQPYTTEQEFIHKQTQLMMEFDCPEVVTGIRGNRRLRYKPLPLRPVTYVSWMHYQQQRQRFEQSQALSSHDSDSESSSSDTGTQWLLEGMSCHPHLAIPAAGLNNTLLDAQVPENTRLSSAPLDALDTGTEPVVEGLSCDPDLDIPAAGLNNTLLDAQVPENTPAPVRDLVAESLLGHQHDGEEESLGTAAKKKAHQKKMHGKKKPKSIVLSPLTRTSFYEDNKDGSPC